MTCAELARTQAPQLSLETSLGSSAPSENRTGLLALQATSKFQREVVALRSARPASAPQQAIRGVDTPKMTPLAVTLAVQAATTRFHASWTPATVSG